MLSPVMFVLSVADQVKELGILVLKLIATSEPEQIVLVFELNMVTVGTIVTVTA